MRDEYYIRAATLADLPALPAIERAANRLFAADPGAAPPVLTPPDDLAAGCAGGRLWVAIEQGVGLVGFALGGVVGENAHLDELDVRPEHGRRGIGTALVATFLAWARAQGYAAATLTTLSHIPWNRPFYERIGFGMLAPDELTPELRELLAFEIARGLPAEGRIAMRMPLA
ncbi:MAG TPA: GNAT family N-acetyltransferase [Candidatus Udaeobacter sp.]|nr:GNAT family N-acetyltransferase [Candidatus Udaeobacter sp.]